MLENKNLSQKEKVQRVKERARELEEMAMQKEKPGGAYREESSFYGGTSSNMNAPTRGTTGSKPAASGRVEDTLEANDMLIDAIRAKLAILDQLES